MRERPLSPKNWHERTRLKYPAEPKANTSPFSNAFGLTHLAPDHPLIWGLTLKSTVLLPKTPTRGYFVSALPLLQSPKPPEKGDVYGSFDSRDAADAYLSENFANPGAVSFLDDVDENDEAMRRLIGRAEGPRSGRLFWR